MNPTTEARMTLPCITAGDLYHLVSLSDPRFSPDGRWLAFVRTEIDRENNGYKSAIWLAPVDGGRPRPFTSGDKRDSAPRWSPDGRWLAFVSNRGDDRAKPQLYLIPTGGGEARRLATMANGAGDPAWSPDGRSLAFTSRANVEEMAAEDNPEDNPAPDPEQVHRRAQEREEAEKAKAAPRVIRRFAYRAETSFFDDRTAQIYVVDLDPETGQAQGKARRLTHDSRNYAEPRWMPDGSALLATVDRQPGVDDLFYFPDVVRVPVDGGEPAILTGPDTADHNPWPSPDGQWVGFVASTDRAPWDLYLARLDGTQERRLTEANAGWLAERSLGAVHDLSWESDDGQPIQGWIVTPPGFEPDRKYPMILSIHGGPHVMWSRHEPTMWHEWQVQAGHGYVVLGCNPRGSDGYGRDFRAALRRRWGEADLPDLLAGVDRLVDQGTVDPDRLVVTGGSYGGFMTVWAIGHDQRFKAAVAQRGVYDLAGLYGTSDIPLLLEWEFDATPWQDPQALWAYSPLAHVEQIRTPLLLLHSENDFRAPIPAAEALFVALRRLKREVELVRYPRDGHELSRSGEPKHRVDRLERIVGWFDQHL
jgi:dipeptidyl aminopeptidase/acylaminoacyl peptidase